MNAVFRYAIQTGKATYNPAEDMQGVLKAKTVEHLPALFDKELSQLLKDISLNPKTHTTTKFALQFTALTACRSGEVRNETGQNFTLKPMNGRGRVIFYHQENVHFYLPETIISYEELASSEIDL